MSYLGEYLRELILRPQGVFAYGVATAFDAKAAEDAGHEALYMGGYAASAIRGFPDMGIISAKEMLEHVISISDTVRMPFIADIDDGYGGIHNVRRTVRDMLTKTRAAGIHIEDQKYPKRCGHIAGKEVLPLEDFAAKLRAAVDVRNALSPSAVLIARTDAFSAVGAKKDPKTGGDIKEAILRAERYVREGADLVWCEFPSPSRESAKAFAEGMQDSFPPLGLAFNMSPSFRWDTAQDPVTTEELISWGYKFRFATYPTLVEYWYAVLKSATEFRTEDPIEAMKEMQRKVAGTSAASIMKVIGVERYQEIERKYDFSRIDKQKISDGFQSEQTT